jgi:oligopeptide transport system substrate-binding protein
VRRFSNLLVALAALIMPSAAQPVVGQQVPQEVRVNFLTQGEPASLDPTRASFTFASEGSVVRQVFEPLLRFDDTLTPRPAAAESYDVSLDGRVYTFHLRQDGRWSDGQPVTAGQFEYSWKRLLDPSLKTDYAGFFVSAGIVGAADYTSGRAPTADNVGVRALDDSTLQVRLSQPFGALPDLAALWVASPLRPDIVAADPEGWTQDPSTYIGNGAFSLIEWAHQDHIALAQNPNYDAHLGWPKPTLTRVTVLMGISGVSDLAALKQDARDWALVPDSEVNTVLEDSTLASQTRQYNELTNYWVHVNNARGPLSNVNVRRALAKSLDRSALSRDIAVGVNMPTTSIIPRGMPGFQEDLGRDLGFDPDGARALLAQAGFPGGQGLSSLTFSFPSTPVFQRRATSLQTQWKQTLGIDMQLIAMDVQSYQQAFADKNYDLAFGGWGADYPDPQDWFGSLFSCNGSYNKYNYCNHTLDQLVARADTATNLTDRLAQYGLVQTILLQDAPVVPLFTRARLVVVKPWVQAIDGGPLPVTPLDEYPGSLFLDKVQISPH